MTKILKFLGIFVFLFPVYTQPSNACVCSSETVKVSLLVSDVVFVGEVIEVESAKEAGVSCVMKEPGSSKLLKIPKLDLSFSDVNKATLKIIEPLKGVMDKTIAVASAKYNGGGNCGVRFVKGSQFLVFASKRIVYETDDEENVSEKAKKENELKIKANEVNDDLPTYVTSICNRTEQLKYMTEELGKIRDFLKTGKWNEAESKPHK